MKVRCPHCRSDVNAPRDVIAEHKTRATYFSPGRICTGSGTDAIAAAISETEESMRRDRDRIARRREEIADCEKCLVELEASVAKAEKKLAALRKKLAAKGGAQ